ncbi:hypothetical protein DFQ28_005277 [Apophysomyces sp. BC1034]|nr:hypothetical protein DFQ30_003442 [Apophysomyces sp. BC1015]KAG0182797.1 hypothetical protein DFQ29_001962 [Apophysomyces sp. BC1021]KAG0193459.1 hypothetical protein DFQ28_005277 [Apophysomyces sp. BC1034]
MPPAPGQYDNGLPYRYGRYRHDDNPPTSNSPRKRTRLFPAPKPSRKSFFEFRLEKFTIGNYVSESDGIKGEDRLRFYLRNHADAESKPDAIALIVQNGNLRFHIEVENIKSIQLAQKTGLFDICINDQYKIEKLENANFSEGGDDPSEGQLAETKRIQCHVDMQNPITQPKWMQDNINDWTDESSRFRQIVLVTDADAPRTMEGVFAEWARTSPIGLPSDRLLFAKVHLNKLDRLFEILMLLGEEEYLYTPMEGLIQLVKTLAKKADVPKDELKSMLHPVILSIPEYKLMRTLDIMWKSEANEE